MHELITEESFDLEKTYEYILSIQVSLNGFSFSIVDPHNKLLVFKDTLLTISSSNLVTRRFSEWYQSEEILQKPFLKTRVIVFSEKYTLVPEQLYLNESKNNITHILFERSKKTDFAENRIDNLNSRLLFALPDGLNNFIHNSIGECKIVHPVKQLIKNLPDTGDKNGVIIFYNENIIYLILFRNDGVMMSNSFKINHSNDVVYFVLATLKKMKIALNTTELFYAGKSSHAEKSGSNLQKYFGAITRLSPSGLTFSKNITEEVISENILLFY